MSGTRMASLRLTVAAGLAAMLWLGGCGPQSVNNLRTSSRHVYTFETPINCEVAYDRIVRRASLRYRPVPGAAHQGGLSAKLADSRESATITFWDSGRIGIRYILTGDLRQIDSARTQVDVYCAAKRDVKEAQLWEQWANMPLEN